MAISKIIYKSSASATPEVWMDVTQDTVTTSTLLSSYTATKNDGTKITGEYVGVSLQSKSATFTPTTSTQTSSILPDNGYALSSVGITVNPIPSAYIIPTGTLSISQNGSGIDVASYASVDVNVAGGGGGVDSDIIQKTLSGAYENSVVTSIGPYMFYSLSQLQSVSFANVTDIGESAFAYCSEMSIAYFPNCESIGNSAFKQCQSLSSFQFSNVERIYGNAFYYASLTGELNLPKAVYIGSYAFAYNLITTVSAPEISTNGASPGTGALYGLESYAFYNCSLLSSVYIPNLRNVSADLFYGCKALLSVSFPSVTIIGSSAFRECHELQTVYCPSCSYIGPYAFASCSKLQSISFPLLSVMLGSYAFNSCASLSWALVGGLATGKITLSAYAFSACSRLLSLYILCSSVASLVNANVFSMTPISTYTTYTGGVRGSIFVPESLYSTYIASTNWVTYSSRFASLTSTEISVLLGT